MFTSSITKTFKLDHRQGCSDTFSATDEAIKTITVGSSKQKKTILLDKFRSETKSFNNVRVFEVIHGE